MKKIVTLALCVVLFSAAAHASSLYVGGQYTDVKSVVNNALTDEGGGSVSGSYLDKKPLDYLYCVDLFTNVYVSSSYDYTTFNRSGVIHGNIINNVGQVAWLLDHYGIGGQGDQANALQAAIWTVINGYNTYHLDTIHSSETVTKLYNTMISGSANQAGIISNYLWINPGSDAAGNSKYQGLVTASPVPEPATMLLFGSGIVGLAGWRLRRKTKIIKG